MLALEALKASFAVHVAVALADARLEAARDRGVVQVRTLELRRRWSERLGLVAGARRAVAVAVAGFAVNCRAVRAIQRPVLPRVGDDAVGGDRAVRALPPVRAGAAAPAGRPKNSPVGVMAPDGAGDGIGASDALGRRGARRVFIPGAVAVAVERSDAVSAARAVEAEILLRRDVDAVVVVDLAPKAAEAFHAVRLHHVVVVRGADEAAVHRDADRIRRRPDFDALDRRLRIATVSEVDDLHVAAHCHRRLCGRCRPEDGSDAERLHRTRGRSEVCEAEERARARVCV